MSADAAKPAAPAEHSGAPRARLGVGVDDVGLARGIGDAALHLAARGRVSALGLMVDGPDAARVAAALRLGDGGDADLGLHLNLTEDLGVAPVWPLRTLLVQAYDGALERAVAEAAIERQLALFEHRVGRPPDFVDGHQHVHQLPLVRDALLAIVQRRYPPAARPWLRRCTPPPGLRSSRLKAWLIGRLGAGPLAARCAAAGVAQNRALLGVDGFDADEAGYRERLRGWLAVARDGDLLMTHPSTVAAAPDPIGATRAMQFRVLSSLDWPVWLAETGLGVDRPSRMLGTGRHGFATRVAKVHDSASTAVSAAMLNAARTSPAPSSATR